MHIKIHWAGQLKLVHLTKCFILGKKKSLKKAKRVNIPEQRDKGVKAAENTNMMDSDSYSFLSFLFSLGVKETQMSIFFNWHKILFQCSHHFPL